MKLIKINGVDHDLDTMSDEAKAQLQSVQFVDVELARLGMQTAALKTARVAYMNALNQALQTQQTAADPVAQMFKGDTMKLG